MVHILHVFYYLRVIVWGSSRDAQGSGFINLQKLRIKNQIKVTSMIPEDFVIATRETNPLAMFVAEVFEQLDLDWKKYVKQNTQFIRPTDLLVSVGDASKAMLKLGWQAKYKMKDFVVVYCNTV
jgi:GDP-D-mannose dehydratase